MSNTLSVSRIRNSYFSYFLMFTFYYLSWALLSSLISVYLIGLGFSAGQASLVVSVSFFASMVTQPFIGSMADRYGLKKISILLFLLSLAGGALFIFCRSLVLVTIVYSFVMVLINGTNPIVEKLATASPFAYGKIRIWGTIGYAAGTQLAGTLYDAISPSAVFAAFIVSMVLCIAGMKLTEPDVHTEIDEPELQPDAQKKMDSMLKNRTFVFYLVIFALFSGVTAAANTFIPSMFTSEGLPASTASVILSAAVLFELPVVFFSGRFMDRMTSRNLSLTAFVMVLIQMLVYGFDMPAAWSIPVTLLTKHTASMLYIMINLKIVSSLIPDSQQITALALAAAVKNLASIVFNNLAGTLIDSNGYPAAFLVMAAVMAFVIVLTFLIRLPAGTDRHLFS